MEDTNKYRTMLDNNNLFIGNNIRDDMDDAFIESNSMTLAGIADSNRDDVNDGAIHGLV